MSKNFIQRTAYALLLSIMWVAQSHSTTLKPLSLEALTHYSSNVVRGQFVKFESQWSQDKSAIYTRAIFSVEDSIVGKSQREEIVVYLPGGTVDGATTFVVGGPKLDMGEPTLLMLSEVPREHLADLETQTQAFNVVGLSQGIFRLKQDPESEKMMVISHAASLLTTNEVLTEFEEGVMAPPGGLEGTPIEEFVLRVRELSERKTPFDPDDSGKETVDEGADAKGDPREEIGKPDADQEKKLEEESEERDDAEEGEKESKGIKAKEEG